MPTYEFECATCGSRHETIMKMTEISNYSRKCADHSANAPANCPGQLEQVYDRRDGNFVLLGHGWTPKFGPINRG